MTAIALDRYVIGRDGNVVRVNFVRDPEPPPRPFSGAAALRACVWLPPDNATTAGIKAGVAR